MSIQHKLFLLLGMMGVVLITFTLVLVFIFTSINNSFQELKKTEENLRNAHKVYSNTIMELFAVRTYFQTRNELQEVRFKSSTTENDALIAQLKEDITDKNVLDLLYAFEGNYKQLRVLEENILIKSKEKDTNVEKLLDSNYDATSEKVHSGIRSIIKEEEQALTQTVETAESNSRSAFYGLLFIVIVSTLYLLGIGFFIISTIIHSINNLKDVVQAFAQGDFKQRAEVNSTDEIGKLGTNFNTMAASLSNYYGELMAHAQKLGKKTESLTLSNEKIGEGWLQIQKEKARLTASLDSLWIGIAIADMSGEVVFLNSALIKLLGTDKITSVADIQKMLYSTPDFSQKFLQCKQEQKLMVLKPVTYGTKTFQVVFTPITMNVGGKEGIGTTIVFEQLS